MATRSRPLARPSRRKYALVLIGCGLVGVLAVGTAIPVDAATTRKLRALKVDPRNSDDRIYNYDFTRTRASRRNVDWGVDLLFYNNAEVDKIKNSLPLVGTGSKKNARLDDGGGWFWDEDGGRKGTPCTPGVRLNHYRVYADRPGGDRNFSRGLGFYVIGSTHRDVNECGGGTRYFGETEAAETDVAALASGLTNWQIYRNNYDMRNRESRRREGDHRWGSNGLATMFRIP